MRTYPGTEIADGTRYMKAKFPQEVTSLPYSSKFETAEGTQYFRIIHDRQVKTCRLCMDPGHVLKDCPEFKCYQCEEQGHFARSCNAVRCPECRKVLVRCECWMEGGEDSSEQETDMVVNVSGQKQREIDMDNILNKEMEDGGPGEEEHQMETEEQENKLDGEITTLQGYVQRNLDMSEEQEKQNNKDEGNQEGRRERKGEEKSGGLGEDNREEEHQVDTGEKEKEPDGEITMLQGAMQTIMDMSEEQEEQKNNEECYQEKTIERKGEDKCRKER